jgi:hypothetical protein
MPNGQDPSKPSQKPGSDSGSGTGTGGGTGTGAGPASGVPGKIKPQEDDRPPQTHKVMTAAIVGLIDKVIGGSFGVAYCAD